MGRNQSQKTVSQSSQGSTQELITHSGITDAGISFRSVVPPRFRNPMTGETSQDYWIGLKHMPPSEHLPWDCWMSFKQNLQEKFLGETKDMPPRDIMTEAYMESVEKTPPSDGRCCPNTEKWDRSMHRIDITDYVRNWFADYLVNVYGMSSTVIGMTNNDWRFYLRGKVGFSPKVLIKNKRSGLVSATKTLDTMGKITYSWFKDLDDYDDTPTEKAWADIKQGFNKLIQNGSWSHRTPLCFEFLCHDKLLMRGDKFFAMNASRPRPPQSVVYKEITKPVEVIKEKLVEVKVPVFDISLMKPEDIERVQAHIKSIQPDPELDALELRIQRRIANKRKELQEQHEQRRKIAGANRKKFTLDEILEE